jgi:iron complex outermembrane receptor protein
VALAGASAGALAAVPAADRDAASADTLQEVVVTATKTAVNILDVPIAIAAFTGAQLRDEGISSVSAIANLTPSVNLDTSTAFSGSRSVLSASIRGIGQDDFDLNFDPAVGVYVDGIYLARNVGTNLQLLDVERVEVLRGPQGTLFGRNTIGGAISIVTRDPSDQFSATGVVTVGSLNRRDLQASVDLPISDTLHSTFAVSSIRRDGYQKLIPYNSPTPYVTDGARAFSHLNYDSGTDMGGQNETAIRGKLAWRNDSGLKVTLTGDYARTNETSAPVTLLQASTTGTFNLAYNNCLAGITAPNVSDAVICGPRAQFGTGIFGANLNPATSRLTWGNQYKTGNIDESYASGPNFVHITNYGLALTAESALTDTLTLRSITGYRNLDFMNGVDTDGSPLQFYESTFGIRQHQISQELQLIGKAFNNRLNYVFGGYYFGENGQSLQKLIFAQGLQQINTDTTISTGTEAAFTRLNFQATDKLSFTVGGRINSEQQQLRSIFRELNGYTYRNFGCYPGSSTAVPPGLPPFVATCQDFVNFLGPIIFGASTFAFPVAGDPNRYSPLGTHKRTTSVFTWTGGAEYHLTDKSMLYTSYATGYKAGGWTTRLIFPSNVQPEFGPEKSGTVEVGFKSSFLEDRANASIALFSTEHRDIQLSFIAPGFGTPTIKNAGTARINGLEAEASAVVAHGFKMGGTLAYLDAKYTSLKAGVTGMTLDSSLPKTPKWKASLNPEYVASAFRGQVRAGLQLTYTSSQYNDTENSPMLKRPATELLNGSIGYVADSRWTLTVGGTNLTNKRVLIAGAAQPSVMGYFGTYNEPREWYLQLRASL